MESLCHICLKLLTIDCISDVEIEDEVEDLLFDFAFLLAGNKERKIKT